MSSQSIDDEKSMTPAFIDDQDIPEVEEFIDQHFDMVLQTDALSTLPPAQLLPDVIRCIEQWRLDDTMLKTWGTPRREADQLIGPLQLQNASLMLLAVAFEASHDLPDGLKASMSSYAQSASRLLSRLSAKYWLPRGQTQCSAGTQKIIDDMLAFHSIQRVRTLGFANISTSRWYRKLGKLNVAHLPGSYTIVRQTWTTTFESWLRVEALPMMEDLSHWLDAYPDITALEKTKLKSRIHTQLLHNTENQLAEMAQDLETLRKLGHTFTAAGEATLEIESKELSSQVAT